MERPMSDNVKNRVIEIIAEQAVIDPVERLTMG